MDKTQNALARPFGTLSGYDPSLRESLPWKLAGAAGRYLGAGRSTQQYIANRALGAMDFIPGVGEVLGADDARRDFDAGNYGMAAANLGLTAVGAVPGAGDALASAGRKGMQAARSNYLRNLGEEVPDLYREMNAERALNFFQPGGLNGPFGQQELYWSNAPDLARGQKGNTGIRFRMSAEGVQGIEEVKSKPGLEFVAATSGGKEYVSRDGVDFSKVREVTVDPAVMFGGAPEDRLFLRHMREKVNAGEFVEESPDGFTTVYRRVKGLKE